MTNLATPQAVSEEELADLQATVRSLLASKSDDAAVRAAMDSDAGYDRDLWRQGAEQLGLNGLAIPEHYGGAGFGFVELGVALRELGRALVPSPFFSSVVLASSTLLAAEDEAAAAAYLPGIASGSVTGTLAVIEADGQWRHTGFSTTATPVGDEWTLTGHKTLVPDAVEADFVIVAATTAEGPGLFLVDDADLPTAVALRPLDPTRRIASLDFAGCPATRLGVLDAATVLDQVLDRAMTALAAEQVGAARACLDLSVAYAKEREQFGRKIGSFQAVKHKCADMFVRLEVAEATASEAARAVDGLAGAPEAAEAAALAHAVCSEAFMDIAKETIQVHGGIGFTWEHQAHLYFRRAKATQLMFGGPGSYYERLLDRWGI